MFKQTGIAAAIVLAATSLAQSAAPPSGTAIDIPNSEIQRIAQRNAGAPVSDHTARKPRNRASAARSTARSPKSIT